MKNEEDDEMSTTEAFIIIGIFLAGCVGLVFLVHHLSYEYAIFRWSLFLLFTFWGSKLSKKLGPAITATPAILLYQYLYIGFLFGFSQIHILIGSQTLYILGYVVLVYSINRISDRIDLHRRQKRAKRLKTKGFSLQEIINRTGLSKKEIEKL